MSSGDTKAVLFLCSGNYYRSRFAEIYFNWRAECEGVAWRADSRGMRLYPENVGPISRYTLQGLANRDIEVPENLRFPMVVDEQDLENASHIIAVKAEEHRPVIADRYPDWVDRVEFWDVHDIDCQEPGSALEELERHVVELFERLRKW